MHENEVDVHPGLVAALLASQFPQWSGLPLRRVPSAGTDNALYRLGADMVVRLPRIHWAVPHVIKEFEWLPRLAPRLPVAVPEPLGLGGPAEGYPWPWAVYRWLEGVNPEADAFTDAAGLAAFVVALRGIDPAGGPTAGTANFFRGVPLAQRDAVTREAIGKLHGEVDVAGVTAAWDEALAAPAWDGPGRWVHGDLSPGNLLVDRAGRLVGVIDFGGLGVGDPAVDLMPGWSLFARGAPRRQFRAAADVDDAAWARGRGWALYVALINLPYYRDTNPVLAASARHVIAEVLAERGG